MAEHFNYTVHFSRGREIKYISHLDMMRVWERLLRRAALPVCYSEGFNQRARLSLASPLPVGVLALDELADIYLLKPLPADAIQTNLVAHSVPGLTIGAVEPYTDKRTLPARLRAAEYEVVIAEANLPTLQAKLDQILASENYLIAREREGKVQQYDLRPVLMAADLSAQGEQTLLRMRLRHDGQVTGRPMDVLAALSVDLPKAEITRTKLLLAP